MVKKESSLKQTYILVYCVPDSQTCSLSPHYHSTRLILSEATELEAKIINK